MLVQLVLCVGKVLVIGDVLSVTVLLVMFCWYSVVLLVMVPKVLLVMVSLVVYCRLMCNW